MEMIKKKKPIYLYDLNGNLLQTFKTTDDFSVYCGYDRMYIYHNLKYCKRIRINGKWYIIKRKDTTNGNKREIRDIKRYD